MRSLTSYSRTLRSRRPLCVAVGSTAAAGLLALAVAPLAQADQQTNYGPKPTVVLVHGAFADASGWNGVVKRLQKDGYTVVAPANPLRGLPQDATYIASEVPPLIWTA